MMLRVQRLHGLAPTAVVIAPFFSSDAQRGDAMMVAAENQLVGVEGP